MSTFKFGEIQIEVHLMGPDPLHPRSDFYAVKVSHDDTWMETRIERPKGKRTAGSDVLVAKHVLGDLGMIAADPETWADESRKVGRVSQEEIDGTIQVAQNLAPYLPDAMYAAFDRLTILMEGKGPVLGISRKLALPESIRTKEDVANFFAHLYLVDHSSFHPDDHFGEYVNSTGKKAFTKNEAAIRNKLMRQSFRVAQAEGLDIYELAVWVGALVGQGDPENEASAPDWMKSLSNAWV